MLVKRSIPLEEQCIVDVVDFGDWERGYMGCSWCKVRKACMDFNPKKPVKRAKVTRKSEIKIARPGKTLKGFFNLNEGN